MRKWMVKQNLEIDGLEFKKRKAGDIKRRIENDYFY